MAEAAVAYDDLMRSEVAEIKNLHRILLRCDNTLCQQQHSILSVQAATLVMKTVSYAQRQV